MTGIEPGVSTVLSEVMKICPPCPGLSPTSTPWTRDGLPSTEKFTAVKTLFARELSEPIVHNVTARPLLYRRADTRPN